MDNVIDFKSHLPKPTDEDFFVMELELGRMPNSPWRDYHAAVKERILSCSSDWDYRLTTSGESRILSTGVVTGTYRFIHSPDNGETIHSISIQGGFTHEALRIRNEGDAVALGVYQDELIRQLEEDPPSDEMTSVLAYVKHGADVVRSSGYKRIGDLEMAVYQYTDHSFTRVIYANRKVSLDELYAIEPQYIIPVINDIIAREKSV
jgi:hypothetical protein